jgi:hypothetical protein
VVGGLIGLGLSAEQASVFERHLREGRTLVVVKAAHRYGEALELLRRAEAHEIPTPPTRPRNDPTDRDKLT